MAGKDATKFEIPCFTGTLCTLRVKDEWIACKKGGCDITLQEKKNKSERMTDKQFEKNDVGKSTFCIRRFSDIHYED